MADTASRLIVILNMGILQPVWLRLHIHRPVDLKLVWTQSELAFRMLCRRHGATAAYTPMLHSRLSEDTPKYLEEHFTTCKPDRYH